MEYDNKNRGALFKRTDKTSDKQPDYSGPLNVNGEEFWISAWINTSKKSGTKYMSLTVKPKNADTAQPKQSRADDFNDEIGF